MMITTMMIMMTVMMIVAWTGTQAELLTALRELEAMSGFQSLGSEQQALLREMVAAAEHCKLKDFLATVDSITLVEILANLQAADGHDLEVYLNRHLLLESDRNGCTAQASTLAYTNQPTDPATTRKITTPFYIQHRPDYTQPPTTLAPDCNPPGIHCIVGRAAADIPFQLSSRKESESQKLETQSPGHSSPQTSPRDIFSHSKYDKSAFNLQVQKTGALHHLLASTTSVWKAALDEHPSFSLHTSSMDAVSSRAYGTDPSSPALQNPRISNPTVHNTGESSPATHTRLGYL